MKKQGDQDLQVPGMSAGYIMMLLTSTGSKGGGASLGPRFREIGFQINEMKVPILSKSRKTSNWTLM